MIASNKITHEGIVFIINSLRDNETVNKLSLGIRLYDHY